MLTTDDEQLAERVRLLSLHGLSRGAWNRYAAGGSWAYEVLAPGFNYVMSDIQAAIGLHQFEKLQRYQERRTFLASRYNELFAEMPEVIRPPVRDDDIVHPWHLYPVRLDGERLRITREEAIDALRERGIGTSVHFIPINLHSFFRQELGVGPGDFPVAERVFSGLISLPLYPRMADSDVDRVAGALGEIVGAGRR
jgi:dTDP-4-amino-4,6-dideoxygalactose transaminase